MSVEINIHTKKCKINKTSQEKQSGYANLSEEKLIEIQAEAYYRAMKRMEEEKKEQEVLEKKKHSKLETFLYLLCVVFCPIIVNRKFKTKRAYDSLLVIIISGAFFFIGFILRLAGIACIINSIFQFISVGSLCLSRIEMGGIGLMALLYGSIFVIAGDEFSKEKDSSKIYGYSASIIAIVGCVISIVAIILTEVRR